MAWDALFLDQAARLRLGVEGVPLREFHRAAEHAPARVHMLDGELEGAQPVEGRLRLRLAVDEHHADLQRRDLSALTAGRERAHQQREARRQGQRDEAAATVPGHAAEQDEALLAVEGSQLLDQFRHRPLPGPSVPATARRGLRESLGKECSGVQEAHILRHKTLHKTLIEGKTRRSRGPARATGRWPRTKDFSDHRAMATTFEFGGESLVAALAATFPTTGDCAGASR